MNLLCTWSGGGWLVGWHGHSNTHAMPCMMWRANVNTIWIHIQANKWKCVQTDLSIILCMECVGWCFHVLDRWLSPICKILAGLSSVSCPSHSTQNKQTKKKPEIQLEEDGRQQKNRQSPFWQNVGRLALFPNEALIAFNFSGKCYEYLRNNDTLLGKAETRKSLGQKITHSTFCSVICISRRTGYAMSSGVRLARANPQRNG